jgi:hypothetical protein
MQNSQNAPTINMDKTSAKQEREESAALVLVLLLVRQLPPGPAPGSSTILSRQIERKGHFFQQRAV